ncbi:MAG: metalloregulator ArsR/SmtB family transcription factor [Lachnospiraceae bacterium]|nr:metalloregulator ArsR/SmtB family transcription factor [Lachnospiraceae bacterium]
MAICDVEHCDDNELHRDRILKALEMMPDEDELCDLAELFKVFGDSTRIRILYALFDNEICVCDLAETLSMTQSAISHQLKILKQANLVRSRREGRSIFYTLSDDHVRTIIGCGLEHIEE